MILALMLVSALTIMSAASLQRKSSFSTSTSTRSIQTADAAVEQVFYQIYKVKDASPAPSNLPTLTSLAIALGTAMGLTVNCTIPAGSTAIIAPTTGDWKIGFYKGVTGTGSMTCSSNTWRTDLSKIRAQGVANGTIRSLEVWVKGPSAPLP